MVLKTEAVLYDSGESEVIIYKSFRFTRRSIAVEQIRNSASTNLFTQAATDHTSETSDRPAGVSVVPVVDVVVGVSP